MTIRPINDRLVVRRAAPAIRMPGALVAPIMSDQKANHGIVLATGPGKTMPNGVMVPMDVKPGDTVHFSQYSGHEVSVDGDEVVILRECECTHVEEPE